MRWPQLRKPTENLTLKNFEMVSIQTFVLIRTEETRGKRKLTSEIMKNTLTKQLMKQ